MMTNGFGSGNCWYNGEPTQYPYQHVFTCEDTGIIKSGVDNTLSFQFSISNLNKDFSYGSIGTETGKVVPKLKTLTCTLEVNTWSSATTSN